MQICRITENIRDYSAHSFESEYGGTLAKDLFDLLGSELKVHTIERLQLSQ